MSQGQLDATNLPEPRLVELTGAHPTTVRRWRRRSAVPVWLERLIRVCVNGQLDDIDAAWRGWRIARGELVSPEGWTFTPGTVRAAELYRRQVVEYHADRRHERLQLEADPVNVAGIERLAVLQAALSATQRALDDITHRLSTLERNRLFSSASSESRSRSENRLHPRWISHVPFWRRASR